VPYPDKHVAIIRPLVDFKDGSIRTTTLDNTNGIKLLSGKLKDGDGKMVEHSYHFPVSGYTEKEAKDWLKEHKLKYVKFEPATSEKKSAQESERIADAPVLCAPIGQRGTLAEHPEAAKWFGEQVPGVRAEDVFVFSVQPSSQVLDAFGTRMSANSMQRYLQDAVEGCPLMTSHRTGGFFSPESPMLPMGYSFHGVLTGQAVDESPWLQRGMVPGADADAALKQAGLSLVVWDYMLLDHYPNGKSDVGTADIARGIAGRVIRDVSIGFGHALPSRVQYICGLCGRDMVASMFADDDENECPHMPLIPDKNTGLMAFAWIRHTMMNEHSLVWRGATPGAGVIAHARSLARRQMYRPEEIDRVESAWGVLLTPPKFRMEVAMPDRDQATETTEPAETAETLEAAEAAAGAATAPEAAVAVPEGAATEAERAPDSAASDGEATDGAAADSAASATIEDVITRVDEMGSRVEALGTSILQLIEAVQALVDLQTQQESDDAAATDDATAAAAKAAAKAAPAAEGGQQAAPDPLQAALVQVNELTTSLRSLVTAATTVPETEVAAVAPVPAPKPVTPPELIERAIQSRIRATGTTFVVESYRARLAGMDEAQVKAEIQHYEHIVAQRFTPGRVVGRPGKPAATAASGEQPIQPRDAQLYRA
jgi:hypothetical protein